MLTYQTTHTVKCVYFDGEPAALMGSSLLDTKMLHIYGNISASGRQVGILAFCGRFMRALGFWE
jgi:hypothetical protein